MAGIVPPLPLGGKVLSTSEWLFDVFCVHDAADTAVSDRVREITAHLVDNGLNMPGHKVTQLAKSTTAAAVASSGAAVIFVTADLLVKAAKKPNDVCAMELEAALTHARFVVPIILDVEARDRSTWPGDLGAALAQIAGSHAVDLTSDDFLDFDGAREAAHMVYDDLFERVGGIPGAGTPRMGDTAGTPLPPSAALDDGSAVETVDGVAVHRHEELYVGEASKGGRSPLAQRLVPPDSPSSSPVSPRRACFREKGLRYAKSKEVSASQRAEDESGEHSDEDKSGGAARQLKACSHRSDGGLLPRRPLAALSCDDVVVLLERLGYGKYALSFRLAFIDGAKLAERHGTDVNNLKVHGITNLAATTRLRKRLRAFKEKGVPEHMLNGSSWKTLWGSLTGAYTDPVSVEEAWHQAVSERLAAEREELTPRSARTLRGDGDCRYRGGDTPRGGLTPRQMSAKHGSAARNGGTPRPKCSTHRGDGTARADGEALPPRAANVSDTPRDAVPYHGSTHRDGTPRERSTPRERHTPRMLCRTATVGATGGAESDGEPERLRGLLDESSDDEDKDVPSGLDAFLLAGCSKAGSIYSLGEVHGMHGCGHMGSPRVAAANWEMHRNIIDAQNAAFKRSQEEKEARRAVSAGYSSLP